MKLSEEENQILKIIKKHKFKPQMKKKWFSNEIEKILFNEKKNKKLKLGEFDSEESKKIWNILKILESKNLIKFKPVFYKINNRYRQGYELIILDDTKI
jgi:hypothetical protein